MLIRHHLYVTTAVAVEQLFNECILFNHDFKLLLQFSVRDNDLNYLKMQERTSRFGPGVLSTWRVRCGGCAIPAEPTQHPETAAQFELKDGMQPINIIEALVNDKWCQARGRSLARRPLRLTRSMDRCCAWWATVAFATWPKWTPVRLSNVLVAANSLESRCLASAWSASCVLTRFPRFFAYQRLQVLRNMLEIPSLGCELQAGDRRFSCPLRGVVRCFGRFRNRCNQAVRVLCSIACSYRISDWPLALMPLPAAPRTSNTPVGSCVAQKAR